MVEVVNKRYQRPDIDVTRNGPFGNPYTHLVTYGGYGIRVKTREIAIDRFAEYFYSERGRQLRQRCMLEIPDGATIGCVCHPLRCHADIIAGYLNWKRNPEFNGPKARSVIYET